ncbi:MAG TPA: ECF-type sigma factor, partial [Phycisphaerae bacterium]|nr:ECF-type sigma factor [Phycisphaerae bacterium]
MATLDQNPNEPAQASGAGPVTRLLHAAASGEHEASNELLPLVYEQLLAIARQRMQLERPDHTLQATALVHEAYMRLVGSEPVSWPSRASFFCAAAEAMRRILIDHARRRGRIKRGGPGAPGRREPLDAIDLAVSTDPDDVLALDAALTRLA